jgi:hypothetical protein
MGTKRGRLEQSIQAAQTQKMAAYQAQMRKMEAQKLAEDEARAVLPVLQAIDIRSPDYHDRVGSLLSQFPLSAESPAVSNILQAHDRTLNGMRQQQEAAAREDAEDEKMLADDPVLQQIFTQKAKIEGPEAARAAIRAKRFNDAQALRLIELGESPDDSSFKIDNQYFDKKKIDMLEAKKKSGGGGARITPTAIEKYTKAVALANSEATLDEERDMYKMAARGYEAMYPEIKNMTGSSLPESKASDTGKPAPAGKTKKGRTFEFVE